MHQLFLVTSIFIQAAQVMVLVTKASGIFELLVNHTHNFIFIQIFISCVNDPKYLLFLNKSKILDPSDKISLDIYDCFLRENLRNTLILVSYHIIQSKQHYAAMKSLLKSGMLNLHTKVAL